YRLTNTLIGATAADVAFHRRVNVVIARPRILFQQRGGPHNLSALAVAALRHVRLPPRLLQRMRGALAKALNSYDFFAPDRVHCSLATAHGCAIQMNGASAA